MDSVKQRKAAEGHLLDYHSLLFEIYAISFYRAMHFSAKRGIAIACRLSVRLSVCL